MKNLIYKIVGYVWAGIGDPFSVIVLLSLFWKKFSARGAFAVVCTGMPFTIFWIMSGLDERVIAALFMSFAFSLVVGVVASLIWPDRQTA